MVVKCNVTIFLAEAVLTHFCVKNQLFFFLFLLMLVRQCIYLSIFNYWFLVMRKLSIKRRLCIASIRFCVMYTHPPATFKFTSRSQ